MDGIQYADGFDAPDRLAFGLAAGQLLTVAAGALLAFAIAHLPLPGALTIPCAVAVAAIAAGLGWLRFSGRGALDWAVFATRHLAFPRTGIVRLGETREREAPLQDKSQPGGAKILSLRTRLVSATTLGVPDAMDRPSMGMDHRGAHRLAFFSLKGGTGRTTLAVEVAAALAAQASARELQGVALVDLDLRSASVGARLGLAAAGIVDYATSAPDGRRVGDVLLTHSSGVRVVLGPSHPVSPDWPVTPAVVREALRGLELGGASTVILDLSPELSTLTRAALQAVDEVIVVFVPTASGIHDAYRTTQQLRALGVRDRLRYAVNRARGCIDVSEAMTDLDGELIAEIPEDVAIVEAENAHRPLVLDADGRAAIELRRLARRVLRVSPSAVR